MPPLPTKLSLGVSGSLPAIPTAAASVPTEPARGIAAPPVPQVRPCAYRDVRLRTADGSRPRVTLTRAPPPSRPGSSSDPPIGAAGKRPTSRPPQPSRDVRSRQSPVRDRRPDVAQEHAAEDVEMTGDQFMERLLTSHDPSIVIPEGRIMYTTEQWRRYFASHCWRWSVRDSEWYEASTGWWWDGDQYKGRWRWYPGEERSRSPLRRRPPRET